MTSGQKQMVGIFHAAEPGIDLEAFATG